MNTKLKKIIEVLNELNDEGSLDDDTYTKVYDMINDAYELGIEEATNNK